MIFPIGRETLLARFPWATSFLVLLNVLVFFGTWPSEKAFLSIRWPDSPLVSEGKALAAMALDGGSTLPADVRVRLEDLRAHPHFPDEEADKILQSIQKNFDYLPTLKRLDWDLRYAAYLQARQEAVQDRIPWRSVLSRYVFRSDDFFWPRLATHMWVHAGILHFLGTLFFLWLVGAHMEQAWGSLFTVLLYVVGGVAAGTAVHRALPGGEWVLLGGTGAGAALMGAFLSRHAGSSLRFFYIVGVSYGVFSLPAWTALLPWGAVVYYTGWLTDGRLAGAASHWFHGTGFLTGLAAGWLWGLRGEGDGDDDVSDANPLLLDQRAARAAKLFQEGKAPEARDIYQSILEADPGHLPALQGSLALCEFFQQEEDAAHMAVKVIRAAMEKGRGQTAEDVFRKWSLRLFQTKLPPQERLILAQDLEALQLWREALAYYRSVTDMAKGSPFAAKALFASAKIFKEQMKKPDDAVPFLRQLLEPPYDLEWRPLAEGELRAMGKL